MISFKYILAIIYFLTICIFGFISIKVLGINSLDSFSFSKINDLIFKITNNHFYIILGFYFIFSLIWVLMLGFISPVLLVAGYLISPFYGCLVVSLANAISGTILIFFIRKFFYSDIKRFFPKKANKIIEFINKETNSYFLIFRLAGGFGIPSQIQNLIPVLTKIRYFNYFIISFFGCLPIMYLTTNIGYSMRYIDQIDKLELSTFTNPKFIIFIGLAIFIIFFVKEMNKKLNKNK